MNEHDFDDGMRQVLVCALGEDCGKVTKQRFGSPMAIYDAIKNARNEAGCKRQLYVIRTSCQGWCGYAPVIQVLPEGKVYQDIDPKDADKVVQALVNRDDKALENKEIWDFGKPREQNNQTRRSS